MKFLNSLIVLTLAFSFLLPSSSVFANNDDSTYIKGENAKIVTEEEDREESMKNKDLKKKIISIESGPNYEKDKKPKSVKKGTIGTLGEDPGAGATRIVSYAFAGSGLIEKDSDRAYGMA